MIEGGVAGLRRVPMQARSREKVERALSAAEEIVEVDGVSAISLTAVARGAGVSVGALYQYLPDREAILAALTERYHARHEAHMDALVDHLSATRVPDPVGALLAGVVAVYREQAMARRLRVELQAASDPRLTREHKNRQVGRIRRLLEAYYVAPSDSAETIARAVFFSADGLMHEAFADDPDGDPRMLAELETMMRTYVGERLVPTTSR